MRRVLRLLLAVTALAQAGAEDPAEVGRRFFRAQILPILEKRCFECHSQAHEVEGGLALDSREDWMTGGDHGPAVRPRDLRRSPLIQAIRHLDAESAMPPEEKLSEVEIALLETWVLLGAPDPRSRPVAAP